MTDIVMERPVLRSFFRIAGRFWTGEKRWRAILITGAVLLALAAQITMQVGVNSWTRWFFDALEKRDLPAIWKTMVWLPGILAATAAATSALVISRMLLQTRWREWMTNRLVGWWIADQRYYRLPFVAEEQTAPEYRIGEDVRLAIEPLVELALGLLAAAVTAATFATILWSVAGSAAITIAGTTYVVPGYMAVAAVIYAVVASLAAYVAGRPLVTKVATKNEAEAQFRAEMTRLRENAESIALIRGDADELTSVKANYAKVVGAWLAIIRQQGIISIVLNTNGALFPVVPLLLITPKYLAGDITLGAVMQVVAAFSAVQAALIWFVDNFVRLAEWYASVMRVQELVFALEEIDVGTIMEGETQITLGSSDDGAIHIEHLSVAHRSGRLVIAEASTRIEPGEKVLIAGESGTGKSTLIRAIAGLWPWGSGTIRLPAETSVAFLPQRPYLPLGTLRAVTTYPDIENPPPDEEIVAAMKRCGLGYLAKRLDDEDEWDRILSGGERQRVAFVRLVLHKPKIIVMDEATSALDEDSQTSLLDLFQQDLADATLISVGHRPGLEEFHDRKLTLHRRDAGATMTSRSLGRRIWRIFGVAPRPSKTAEAPPVPHGASPVLGRQDRSDRDAA